MTRLFSLAGIAVTVILLTSACGTNHITPAPAQTPSMPLSASASTSPTSSTSATPHTSATPGPQVRHTSTPPPATHRATTSTTSTTSRLPPPKPPATTPAPRPPVPNVVGMALTQAKARLASAGDKYFVLCGGGPVNGPNGTVAYQNPAGGTPSTWNTLVELSVTWVAPLDPSSPPSMTGGPIPQKPCPYS